MRKADLAAGGCYAYSTSGSHRYAEAARLLSLEMWSWAKSSGRLVRSHHPKPFPGYPGVPAAGYPVLLRDYSLQHGRPKLDPVDPEYADLAPDGPIPEGLRIEIVTAPRRLWPYEHIAELAEAERLAQEARDRRVAAEDETRQRQAAARRDIEWALGYGRVSPSDLTGTPAVLEAIAAALADRVNPG